MSNLLMINWVIVKACVSVMETLWDIANEYTGISGSALLHYRMNDTAASTTVVDSSTSSYNGTAQQNTSSLTTTGKMNTALSFDGSTDYIDVNKNSSELGLTSERTYVVWFKTSLTQGTQANLVGNYQWIPGNIDYGIGLGFKNGDIRIDVGNGTSTDQEFTWTPPSSYTGSWHHVAMTWDGNTIKLYYDGAEKLSQTAILAESTHDYVLGKWTDYWAAGKYNGDMDSVMIFDRALSASDITALYTETNETTLTTMMVGTDAISYDANGNISVDRKGYQYDYDYENRLERIKDSSLNVIAEFTYDALGRRVETIEYDSTNITTRYYYDGWRVLSETDASNVVHRDYVYGNYIDETVMMVDHASSSDYFYGHDHLFSTVALFDSAGATVERYEYDAYGKAVVITNKGSDGIWFTSDDTVAMTSAKGNPYTFTGRRLDTYDSGAYEVMYYRNRYYDTETGRFLKRDPLGYNDINLFNLFVPRLQYYDGMNLYEYVGSSPVDYVDEFGFSRRRPHSGGNPSSQVGSPAPNPARERCRARCMAKQGTARAQCLRACSHIRPPRPRPYTPNIVPRHKRRKPNYTACCDGRSYDTRFQCCDYTPHGRGGLFVTNKVPIWICRGRLGGDDSWLPIMGPVSHSYVSCVNPYQNPLRLDQLYGKHALDFATGEGAIFGDGYINREYGRNPLLAKCKKKMVCPSQKKRLCSEGPTETPYRFLSTNCHDWATGCTW